MIALAVVVLLAAGAVVVLVLNSGGPTGGQGRSLIKTFSTDFSGQQGDVTDLDSPSGTPYMVQLDQGDTGLEVQNHELVRGNRSNYGPRGAPILITQLPRKPIRVSLSWTFSQGQTDTQTVILGTCAEAFGLSSIQVKVSPLYWTVIYTARRAVKGTGVDIARLAEGDFATPLRTDGSTTYRAALTVDLTKSSVEAELPDNVTRTVTDPRVAKYWGARIGVQIGHLRPTDGDVQVRSFDATVPKG